MMPSVQLASHMTTQQAFCCAGVLFSSRLAPFATAGCRGFRSAVSLSTTSLMFGRCPEFCAQHSVMICRSASGKYSGKGLL